MELQFNLNSFVVEDALRAVSFGVFGTEQKSYKDYIQDDNPIKLYPDMTDGIVLEAVPSDDPTSQYVLNNIMMNSNYVAEEYQVPGPIIINVNIGPNSYIE